ncbi:MAG: DNA cytosine methyltransferase [Clostridia bacterium]|nr:DNA cytosine methyltransferase [Clostridia bacterium]
MFLVRAPLQFVRNNDESMFLLSMALQRRYYVTYSVFRETDYSGFPVNGNQLYIIGIASGIPFDTFEFPQPVYFSYYKDVYTENYYEIDEWYRKHNPALDFGEEPEKHKYYTVKKRKFVKSETVGYNMFGGTYYADDYGLRRVTHNEYARLKGYGYYNFNECSNRFKMYRRIASAPNVFIVRALAESVLKYLHEINTSDLKPKLEVFAENESGKDLKKRSRKDKENDIRKDIVFPKQKLLNIHIEKLKGLKTWTYLLRRI